MNQRNCLNSEISEECCHARAVYFFGIVKTQQLIAWIHTSLNLFLLKSSLIRVILCKENTVADKLVHN